MIDSAFHIPAEDINMSVAGETITMTWADEKPYPGYFGADRAYPEWMFRDQQKMNNKILNALDELIYPIRSVSQILQSTGYL